MWFRPDAALNSSRRPATRLSRWAESRYQSPAALGADLLWQTTVTGIAGEYVHLGERSIRTRWVAGADGANSRVRRWVNLEAHSRTGLRYAFRRHYRIQPWTDRMEIY